MPDTGAPWNIPYIDGGAEGSLAAFSEDLADAVADGLSAAGGLVAVKHAIFTGTQVESGVTAGNNFAVTNLSITHALADENNRLIISAFFGAAGNSEGHGSVGIAVAEDDGTGAVLIALGDADGDRTRVTAGGRVTTPGTFDEQIVSMPSVTLVHSPNTTASRTYTLRAINIRNETRTLYINRSDSDVDNAIRSRAVSSLVIQEVRA